MGPLMNCLSFMLFSILCLESNTKFKGIYPLKMNAKRGNASQTLKTDDEYISKLIVISYKIGIVHKDCQKVIRREMFLHSPRVSFGIGLKQTLKRPIEISFYACESKVKFQIDRKENFFFYKKKTDKPYFHDLRLTTIFQLSISDRRINRNRIWRKRNHVFKQTENFVEYCLWGDHSFPSCSVVNKTFCTLNGKGNSLIRNKISIKLKLQSQIIKLELTEKSYIIPLTEENSILGGSMNKTMGDICIMLERSGKSLQQKHCKLLRRKIFSQEFDIFIKHIKISVKLPSERLFVNISDSTQAKIRGPFFSCQQFVMLSENIRIKFKCKQSCRVYDLYLNSIFICLKSQTLSKLELKNTKVFISDFKIHHSKVEAVRKCARNSTPVRYVNGNISFVYLDNMSVFFFRLLTINIHCHFYCLLGLRHREREKEHSQKLSSSFNDSLQFSLKEEYYYFSHIKLFITELKRKLCLATSTERETRYLINKGNSKVNKIIDKFNKDELIRRKPAILDETSRSTSPHNLRKLNRKKHLLSRFKDNALKTRIRERSHIQKEKTGINFFMKPNHNFLYIFFQNIIGEKRKMPPTKCTKSKNKKYVSEMNFLPLIKSFFFNVVKYFKDNNDSLGYYELIGRNKNQIKYRRKRRISSDKHKENHKEPLVKMERLLDNISSFNIPLHSKKDILHVSSYQNTSALNLENIMMKYKMPLPLKTTFSFSNPNDNLNYHHGLSKRNVVVEIHILGLFDLTCELDQHTGGHSEKEAVQLAIKHINEMGVIPGHKLVMHINDTKCNTGVGVDAFFHAIYTYRTRLILLLGPACSDVTESLAQITPYWNIVQVAFGSETPVLSDRSSFPLFFRIMAPDSSHNDARVALLRHFKWHTVAILSESKDLYTLALNELVPPLEGANVSLLATITLDNQDDIGGILSSLKEKDGRIFLGSFSPLLTKKVFCEIYRLKMHGQDYAWLLSGNAEDRWWLNSFGTPCSLSQLLEAFEGNFLITSQRISVANNVTISGMTSAPFTKTFAATGMPFTSYVTYAYDAAWAGALALKKVIEKMPLDESSERSFTWGHEAMSQIEKGKKKLSQQTQMRRRTIFENLPMNSSHPFNSTYSDTKLTAEILQQLQDLKFQGASGSISFADTDRVGISAFYQFQDGNAILVGLYHPFSKHLDFGCSECKEIMWPGGLVPIASRMFMNKIETINSLAFIIMSSLACFGIMFAVSFLIFNIAYRKLKCIKLSSPRMNNMTAFGCILVYAAVLLLGLDHATLPSTANSLPIVCTARAYLLSFGFSLSFGSMFAKTYRVYQIFTKSNSAGLVRNKLLQDTQLISLVILLLAADILLVSIWASVDPMRRELHNLTLQISPWERGVVYQLQVEFCESFHQSEWLGVLYVYKGLLLAVGVYMAWETRHVKIQALNDSQYIGMSVYNVVITSVIVLTTAHIIGEHITLSYVLVTTLIIISTTTTLCLLFIPKILASIRQVEGDPVVESMGLKIHCKTRRFMGEDRCEKFYRAEVRNKVYQREIVQLESEIVKLQRNLELIEKVSSPESSHIFFSEKIYKDMSTKKEYLPCKRNDDWFMNYSSSLYSLERIKVASRCNFPKGVDSSVTRGAMVHHNGILHRSLPSLMEPIRLPREENGDITSADISKGIYKKGKDIGGKHFPHTFHKGRIVRRKSHNFFNWDVTDNYWRVGDERISRIDKGQWDKTVDLKYTLNNETQLGKHTKVLSHPSVSFSETRILHTPSSCPLNHSSSSSSFQSGSLGVLPPYPSSSFSCLEGDLDRSVFFPILESQMSSERSIVSSANVFWAPKSRSMSQPGISAPFPSFLKRKNEQASICLANFPSFMVLPVIPGSDPQCVEGSSPSSPEISLSFEGSQEKEITEPNIAEYQVEDMAVLCPLRSQPHCSVSNLFPRQGLM